MHCAPSALQANELLADQKGQLKTMVLLAEMFDHHMRAIGVITVRWSSIDRLIYDILRNRLLLPAAAETLRSLGAGKVRLDFFRKQLEETNLRPEEKDALAGAIKQLQQLWIDRNSIAHGQYGIIAVEDGRLSVSWSDIRVGKTKEPSDHRLEPARVTVDDLVQHADAVSEAAKPLRDFLYRRPK
jgi:hypothetical protein